MFRYQITEAFIRIFFI